MMVSPDVVRACFFFQAEDGIRDLIVTGVQTCALPISALIRMARSLTRSSALIFSTRTVAVPHFVLPSRTGPTQRKWRFHLDRKRGGEGKRVDLGGGRRI